MEEQQHKNLLSEEDGHQPSDQDQKPTAPLNQDNSEQCVDNLQAHSQFTSEQADQGGAELLPEEQGGQQPEGDHQQDGDGEQEMDQEQNEEEQQQQQQQHPTDNHFLSGGLFELVDSISITNLLSENSVDSLRNLLCPPSPVLDVINLKDPKIDELILNTIIKEKAQSAQNTLGEALNYYHKMLHDSQIHHLDKLIRIIKSKKRELHLRSIKSQDSKRLLMGDIAESQANANSFQGSQLSEDPMDIIGLLEGDQLGTMILKKRVLPVYNPSDKSIRFNVHDKYEVKLKISDDIVVTQKSKIDRIPSHIIQTYIFPYLTSSELFSMRAVCNEWRDLVRGTWHTIFKREMLGQIVAAELCNDIEMHFKLMHIRTPFYQKFGSFLQAIVEMIDWSVLEVQLADHENMCRAGKMVILTLLKALGNDISLEKLWDYQDSDWEQAKKLTVLELREQMLHVLDRTFVFDSNVELLKFKKNFIDAPDISTAQLNLLEDKTFLLMALFLRQMFVFGLLRNHLSISQKYVFIAKERLKEVSRGWSPKRGFLEGAYKILLFRYVKIVNGQIVISKDDEDEESGPEQLDKAQEAGQKATPKTQMRVISNRATASTQTEGANESEQQTSLSHPLEETEIVTQSENQGDSLKQKEENSIQPQAQNVSTQNDTQTTITTVKDELDSSETSHANQRTNQVNSESIDQPRANIIAALEEFGKELDEMQLIGESLQQKEEEKTEQPISSTDQEQEESTSEIISSRIEHMESTRPRIPPAYFAALSNLIDGFDEIKEFYSEDLETSLDKLVKSFVAKSKEKQNQVNPEPDYVIVKNGTETRVFLDDETRLEMLIQKFLKFHILMMSLRSHIQERHSTLETVD